MTKADDKMRTNFHHMTRMLDQLEADLEGVAARSERIPQAWHAIAKGGGRGAKVKITLWVEADVLAFFRAIGTGHTSRMADVLKTFMHARLAGLVKGPEAVDYYPKAEVEALGKLQKGTAVMLEALRREREK